jgi:hypothetical protein
MRVRKHFSRSFTAHIIGDIDRRWKRETGSFEQNPEVRTKPMAQSVVVTLEKELLEAYAAYSKAASGKALARESDRLDFAARRCDVTSLTSLLSESPASLIAQLEAEGFDPAKMRVPPEEWFTAAEGLKTVRALAEHVYANLNDFKQPNPILRELRAAEALLVEAEKAGVRFHLTKVSS